VSIPREIRRKPSKLAARGWIFCFDVGENFALGFSGCRMRLQITVQEGCSLDLCL